MADARDGPDYISAEYFGEIEEDEITQVVATAAATEISRQMPITESSGVTCPDCGMVMIFQEGCLLCRSCGYSKCG